jgi:hypothetical protein
MKVKFVALNMVVNEVLWLKKIQKRDHFVHCEEFCVDVAERCVGNRAGDGKFVCSPQALAQGRSIQLIFFFVI